MCSPCVKIKQHKTPVSFDLSFLCPLTYGNYYKIVHCLFSEILNAFTHMFNLKVFDV